MTLTLIIFVLIIFATVNLNGIYSLSKCCPVDKILSINKNDQGGYYYDCNRNDHRKLTGYNLQQNDVSNIPDCNFEQRNIDENSKQININGCIDYTEMNLVSLTCASLPNENVHLFNKCCPPGQSYDFTEQYCVPNENYLNHFSDIFDHSTVIFRSNVPKCNVNDEVFVEYHSSLHEIQMSSGGILISGPDSRNDYLAKDKFCIEGTVNHNNIVNNKDAMHVIVRSCRLRAICEDIPCVRRCCENDQVLARVNNKTECLAHPEGKTFRPVFHEIDDWLHRNKTPISVIVPYYGMLHRRTCTKFLIEKYNNPSLNNYIGHKDGKLYLNDTDEPYDADKYCVEIIQDGPELNLETFTCLNDEPSHKKFSLYPIGLAISCVFLLATLIVYLCLPKLLNLHGKTLVCYVISLLFAYINLCYLQSRMYYKIVYCTEIGYFMFYCFLAAFCWQSVMCFDMWLSFGTSKPSYGLQMNAGRKRFIYYSIYAWALPFTWTMIALFVDRKKLLPFEWRPGIGMNDSMCWFHEVSKYGHLIFFLIPCGLHVLVNTILFILTAIYSSRVKAEIHRMQSASNADSQIRRNRFVSDKEIFVMNIKLFILMGANWIVEIIQTIFEGTSGTWNISDVLNILQGVWIFLIFVCKRRVWQGIQRKLGLEGQRNGMSTPRSTTTTNTINICLKEKNNVSVQLSNPLLRRSGSGLAIQTLGVNSDATGSRRT